MKSRETSPEIAAAVLAEIDRLAAAVEPHTTGLSRLQICGLIDQMRARLKAHLLPRRKPGRKRHADISAAYPDWVAGLRGLPLYIKHIRNFATMSEYRRKKAIRRLNEDLRTRWRREHKRVA